MLTSRLRWWGSRAAEAGCGPLRRRPGSELKFCSRPSRSSAKGSRPPCCRKRSWAAARAAAKPTASSTDSVPPRRPASWAPPNKGSRLRPRRTSRAPMPRGPCNLWAAQLSRSTGREAKSIGRWPTTCTASTCRLTPARRHWAPIVSRGWRLPTSLCPQINDIRRVGGCSSCSSCSRQTRPCRSTGSRASCQPCCCRRAAAASVAGCSTAEITSRPTGCWAARPNRAI